MFDEAVGIAAAGDGGGGRANNASAGKPGFGLPLAGTCRAALQSLAVNSVGHLACSPAAL